MGSHEATSTPQIFSASFASEFAKVLVFGFIEIIPAVIILGEWGSLTAIIFSISALLIFSFLQHFESATIEINHGTLYLHKLFGLSKQQLNLKELTLIDLYIVLYNPKTLIPQYKLRLKDKSNNEVKFGVSFIFNAWHNQSQLLELVNQYGRASGATYNSHASKKIAPIGMDGTNHPASKKNITHLWIFLYVFVLVTATVAGIIASLLHK